MIESRQKDITSPAVLETKDVIEDEFLSLDNIVPVKKDAARRAAKGASNEIELLINEKKWDDILALFYPLDQKLPELCNQTEDIKIRGKLAFVLGQVNRFDDAIRELKICIKKQPDNFLIHNSLAYTAYNSLYAAKNREIFLSGKHKKDRIELAHLYFKSAQQLRPEGITNYYRQGMLFKQIENKGAQAMPLFIKAVENWDKLTPGKKEKRHQQRKNFVKSLYQGASSILDHGSAGKALKMIKRCLKEDEKTDYISLVFKYFALGKVYFQLNRFTEARDALLFAAKCRSGQPSDFVDELLARTYLGLDSPDRALDAIGRIPQKRKRPYICWTLSDILVSLGDIETARRELNQSLERDNMSRHKSLIKLSKIEYLMGNYSQTMEYARKAGIFFEKRWGNVYYNGLFWQALGAYRCGQKDTALQTALLLKSENPGYPELHKLLALINT